LLVGLWLILIAFLLISALPTLAWAKLRPRRSMRLPVIVLVALLAAGLVNEPWLTLVVICLGYLALIPVGIVSYARVRRRRAFQDGTADRPPSP
jgi:CDP-diacylglycerol--serine O-phosphatidyltransferase